MRERDQQCGDDEEFLREVLADLRTEVESQLTIISGIIQVRTYDTRVLLHQLSMRLTAAMPSAGMLVFFFSVVGFP